MSSRTKNKEKTLATLDSSLLIRPETRADVEPIDAVTAAAFGRRAEADLVRRLRARGSVLISLVAEAHDDVVGHILFTPVTLSEHDDLRLAGLAPLSVLPDHQRKGVGSALVRAGLDACRRRCDGVIVLGHPAYYSRFGFVPASRFGISSTFDVVDEAFMALELVPGTLAARRGVIHYDLAFSEGA